MQHELGPNFVPLFVFSPYMNHVYTCKVFEYIRSIIYYEIIHFVFLMNDLGGQKLTKCIDPQKKNGAR